MSELSLKISLGIVAATMISCTGKQYGDRVEDVVEVPDSYSEVEVQEAPELEQWCSDFGSSELEGLVDRAFDENLDLRQGWARLEQARAASRQADATWFPVVTADATAGRSRQPGFATEIGPGGMPTVERTPEEENNFRTSIGANYEIDLWGRLAANRQAAAYDAQAARADVESMAISITSQVAEAWFDVVAQQEKIALLEEQIEIANRYLELTRLRLSQGVSTALDVNQQQQQVENLRGQLEQVKSQRALAEHRLAVLLGKAPSDGPSVATEELPEMPELPASGVPVDLLDRRPDVRSAYLRLQALDRRTAAAARDKLPSLRLSASLFLQAADLGNLLDDIFWSITGTLSQTVFAGGAKNAAQARAEATAKAQLYTYASAIVQAISEVENAVVLEARQEEFLKRLQAQRENAEIALELARDRYRSGTLDYLRVLTSLQSLQQIEQSLVDARRRQISNRLQLCRALGGSWTRDLEPPEEQLEGEDS